MSSKFAWTVICFAIVVCVGCRESRPKLDPLDIKITPKWFPTTPFGQTSLEENDKFQQSLFDNQRDLDAQIIAEPLIEEWNKGGNYILLDSLYVSEELESLAVVQAALPKGYVVVYKDCGSHSLFGLFKLKDEDYTKQGFNPNKQLEE